MAKNRQDEYPDVPLGSKWMGMWRTKKEATKMMNLWKKEKPDQPWYISYNKKDKFYSLWTKTTKHPSKHGWRHFEVERT